MGFWMIGVTKARLSDVQTDAAARDEFTILVIMGSSSSRQDFNRNVGMGSRRQLLEGDLTIIPFTSDSVAGVNLSKVGIFRLHDSRTI